MNNTQNNQGEMLTNNPSMIEKVFLSQKFPQAQKVVLVDHVAALNKEQNIQTAAAYSFYKEGAMVVQQCCKSFVASGYGTADDFYTLLNMMLASGEPAKAADEAAAAATTEEESEEVNTELFDLEHFSYYAELIKYPTRNAEKIIAIEHDYPEYCALTINQANELLKAARLHKEELDNLKAAIPSMIEEDVDTLLRQINRGCEEAICKKYGEPTDKPCYICEVRFPDISRATFLMVWQAFSHAWGEDSVDFSELADKVIFSITLTEEEVMNNL